tara:strand:- start:37 stop:1965 length:1929 start_codon:yes stop_codon:yes gene_type:complete
MNDDEQLELDLPETQKDLSEEGLDEAVKRNEERNQRDYEENKYRNRELQRRQEERKRQQLDIPGLFEAGSGLRTTAALGTEIFLNTLVDPFFEPGTQVAAGTAINWLAQRIRGGELSKGELAAAGLASLIPGGAQGRAITQFAKGSAKGALSGAIETAGMAGIDEGRLPTAEELAAGLGIGAAFGGIVSTPQAAKALQDLRGRIAGQYTPITAYAMSPSQPPKTPAGFQQLGAFYKKGDLGKQLLRSDKPVVNMTKRDGVVTLDQATITEVENIIDDLEAFHDKGLAGQIPKWRLDRPTSQYRGKRRVAYTKPDGTPGQLYLNWSASKQTYVARDVDKLIKAKMNRAVWNVPQSGKKGAVQSVYKTSKAANAALNQKLLNLFDDDPELMQKIIGDTKQIVYVEHIHPGRSPYWNKTRAFGPGDPENLLVIEDTIFPKVKTAIEKQLYDSGRYKNIYADMDAAGDILLRDATTDKLIGRIPGITNQSQVKAGIYRALTGKQPMDLVDIDPTLRPYLAKLHGFDTEDFGRLKDVQAGVPSKAQDKFEEISRLLESKEVQLEASKTGIGKKLSVIKEEALAKEIKALRKEIEQLRLFDTGGEGTGLRTQKQKIKIKKPQRVKKSKGETEESVQIPIEYQGPKYKK